MIMETETVSRTRVYFLSNVCHVCKKEKPEIRCEICGMIFYCTPQHRRDNWYHHSELCRAIYKICQKENFKHLYEKAVGMNSDAFRDLRHDVAAKCTKLLRRNLNPWEYELLYHPRVCNVCHDYEFDNLKTCNGCGYVYTCEKNHFKSDHGKWCRNLKTYCEVITKSKEDLKVTMKDLSRWPESMRELEKNNGKNHSEAEKAIFSEILTYPLTVLHALKAIKALEKENITIHMIGAEMEAEVEPIEKWERYLLHGLINVKIINVLFIGPELKLNLNENEKRHVNLCETCRANKKDIKLEFVPGVFYHDFIRSKKSSEADLICAFNSGMYRRNGFSNHDSWKDTIQELFAKGKPPVIITEYTSHEIKEDLKTIKKEFPKLRFYVEPSINPFASLKPGLNIISEEESPVIFKNYYYTILSNSGS